VHIYSTGILCRYGTAVLPTMPPSEDPYHLGDDGYVYTRKVAPRNRATLVLGTADIINTPTVTPYRWRLKIGPYNSTASWTIHPTRLLDPARVERTRWAIALKLDALHQEVVRILYAMPIGPSMKVWDAKRRVWKRIIVSLYEGRPLASTGEDDEEPGEERITHPAADAYVAMGPRVEAWIRKMALADYILNEAIVHNLPPPTIGRQQTVVTLNGRQYWYEAENYVPIVNEGWKKKVWEIPGALKYESLPPAGVPSP
jgi:hypothetical protein